MAVLWAWLAALPQLSRGADPHCVQSQPETVAGSLLTNQSCAVVTPLWTAPS